MSEHEHSTSHGNESVRYETSDVATRPIVLSVLGLSIFTVVFTLAAHFVYFGLAAREQAASPAASPLAEQYAAKEPPEPRLQLQPRTDLEVMRAAELKILSSYGWVDKEAGVVRVPIERAMQMFVAKGQQSRPGGTVPWTMAARGEAPRQPAEAEGAPDWHGGWKVSREMEAHDAHGAHGAAAAHGAGHGAAATHGGAKAASHDADDAVKDDGHGHEKGDGHGH